MSDKSKIFVIESDPSMVSLYEEVFSMGGNDVEVALGATDAMARLDAMESPPAVMVIDITVKDLGGFEVLRKIKEKPELKRVPIVIATHLAEDSDVEKAFELGAVLYLIKSQYEPAELVEKVREIITAYSDKRKHIPEVEILVKGGDSSHRSGAEANSK